MAKRRMVAASLGSSRKFADIPTHAGPLAEFAQCLYVLLITHADDFGRQSGDAFTVKFAVFPTSPRPESDFNAALRALHLSGLIAWYEIDGAQVLEITEFERFQTGLHKRTASRFPGPSGKFPELPSELNRTEPKGTERRVAPTAKMAYSGERFKVWTWLHEDLTRALGSKPFDLLAWYPKLDAEMVKSGEPIADEPKWLRERLYAAAGIQRPNLFGRKPELVERAAVPGVEETARQQAEVLRIPQNRAKF